MPTETIIEKYLDEGEMKDIAREEWREYCREEFSRRSVEAIISNAAYEIVHKLADESINEDIGKLIAEKVIKVIDDLGTFSVFRGPDKLTRGESPAWKCLQKAVVDQSDLLSEAVRKAIGDIDVYDITRLIEKSSVSIKLTQGAS